MGDCGSSGDNAVFSGRFDHSIDEKGRVSIPVRFREVLQRESHDRLYITNFKEYGQPCLEAYLPNEWENVISKFVNKRMLDPNLQLFETFYVGGAHEVPVDKQGRILIPPKLREFAKLDRDVTFAAMIDHFQLWDRGAHEKLSAVAEEMISNPDFLEKLNL